MDKMKVNLGSFGKGKTIWRNLGKKARVKLKGRQILRGHCA
jgi:hypothetical protein